MLWVWLLPPNTVYSKERIEWQIPKDQLQGNSTLKNYIEIFRTQNGRKPICLDRLFFHSFFPTALTAQINPNWATIPPGLYSLTFQGRLNLRLQICHPVWGLANARHTTSVCTVAVTVRSHCVTRPCVLELIVSDSAVFTSCECAGVGAGIDSYSVNAQIRLILPRSSADHCYAVIFCTPKRTQLRSRYPWE